MSIPVESKLHYAIVEMVPYSGSANSIVRGLFKGIKKLMPDSIFLWLKNGENIAVAYHLQFYTILSIETYDGTVRTYTFFKQDDYEQKKALKDIEDLFDTLKYFVNTEDECMVNTNNYTSIPENYSESEGNKIVSSNYQPTFNKDSVGNINTANKTASAYTYDYYNNVKKEPEPMAFRRRTKKPSSEALTGLTTKLDLIIKGEYEGKFPKVKGEKEIEYDDSEKENTSQLKTVEGNPNQLTDEWANQSFN